MDETGVLRCDHCYDITERVQNFVLPSGSVARVCSQCYERLTHVLLVYQLSDSKEE